MRHGDNYQSVDSFHFNARRHVDEWKKYMCTEKRSRTHMATSWEAPPVDFIKMNIDASFHVDTRNGGWGVIGRDSTSEICVAATGTLSSMYDSMHAEAHALSNAIQIGRAHV